jgi:hypothetical protein
VSGAPAQTYRNSGTDNCYGAAGAIVPRMLAALFARSGAIAVYDTPYKAEPVAVRAVWHERNDGDAAHVWLRGVLDRVCTRAGYPPARRHSASSTGIAGR